MEYIIGGLIGLVFGVVGTFAVMIFFTKDNGRFFT